MTDFGTLRVTFTCPSCGATNRLTAADLHDATMVHCSHCRSAVASVGNLRRGGGFLAVERAAA